MFLPFDALDGDEGGDVLEFIYHHVTLKRKLGSFESGTKFDKAVMYFDQGSLELYDHNGFVVKFIFELVVNKEFKLVAS